MNPNENRSAICCPACGADAWLEYWHGWSRTPVAIYRDGDELDTEAHGTTRYDSADGGLNYTCGHCSREFDASELLEAQTSQARHVPAVQVGGGYSMREPEPETTYTRACPNCRTDAYLSQPVEDKPTVCVNCCAVFETDDELELVSEAEADSRPASAGLLADAFAVGAGLADEFMASSGDPFPAGMGMEAI